MRLLLFISFLLLDVFFAFSQETKSINTDTITIDIEAFNLSEDMSIASSKNDELILLIYDYNDSIGLSDPLISKEIRLDLKKRKQIISIDSINSIQNKWILFMLEKDSERSLDQIDPVIRIHHEKIIAKFKKRDYNGIEKYLEDEDVLGYSIFEKADIFGVKELRFKGIYKMDLFDYKIVITRK